MLARVDLGDSHAAVPSKTGAGPDVLSIDPGLGWLYVAAESGDLTVFDIGQPGLVTIDSDDSIDQPTLNAAAALLNERLVDMTATRAHNRLAVLRDDDRVEALARRVGERVVKVLREYDAAAIEEVFSDGLLNVMEAPEFAQSDKLRRVFSALENRSYLGELVGSVAGAGRVQVFIGHENQPLDMRDVSLVLAPYGRPIYRGNDSFQTRDYRFLGTVGLFDELVLPLNRGDNKLWFAVSEDFGGWAVTAQIVDPGSVSVVAAE